MKRSFVIFVLQFFCCIPFLGEHLCYGYLFSFLRAKEPAKICVKSDLLKQAQENDITAQLLVGLKYHQQTEENEKKESVSWLQRAAAQGDGRAQFHMGLCCAKGIGVKKDSHQGFKWLLQADQTGFLPAQLLLLRAGKVAFDQDGQIQKSITDSFEFYRQEAEKREIGALTQLGLAYESGDGVEKDIKQAISLFQQVGHKGEQYIKHLARCYSYALLGIDGYKDFLEFFQDPDCQYLLGIAYINGIGVKQDERKGKGLLEKGARSEHGLALYHLAQLLESEKGTHGKRDKCHFSELYQQSIEYLYDQAEAGNADAQFALACCYQFRKGVEQDPEEAFTWFERAAKQGDAQAQFHIGYSYAIGEGVEQNEHKAFKWLNAAAQQNFIDAQYQLGRLLCTSNVIRNEKNGCLWLEKAAEQGHVEAQFLLAMNYVHEQGVKFCDTKIIHWLTKAADKGHIEAQYRLATFCDEGWHTKLDHKQAHDLFEKAAQDHVFAKFRLGFGLYHGQGCEKDQKKGKELCCAVIQEIQTRAYEGDPEAKNMIGLSYEFGLGKKQSIQEAERWYQKAVHNGYLLGQQNLARLFSEHRQHKAAYEMYKCAADQGLPRAMIGMGRYYLTGAEYRYKKDNQEFKFIITKNTDIAIEWFTTAAKRGYSTGIGKLEELVEAGNITAHVNLGLCYYNGLGCPRDYEKAVELWEIAKGKQPVAQAYLGECYYLGRGVPQNYAQAVKLFESPGGETKESLFYLAQCYYNGHGVRRNYETAVRLYQAAAEKNSGKAIYKLAGCYWDGKGVSKDHNTANYLYQKAVRLLIQNLKTNDDIERWYLGMCFQDGYGVDPDYTKAVHYYREAALIGNADAQNNLAICYENAWGVPQDIKQAVDWYKKSAENESADGQYNFASCCEKGIEGKIEANPKMAYEYFLKSAENGLGVAQYTVACLLEKGDLVAKDIKNAFTWYKRAAEQGYPEAQYHLGRFYEQGIGTEKNPGQAKRWFGKARRNGFTPPEDETGSA